MVPKKKEVKVNSLEVSIKYFFYIQLKSVPKYSLRWSQVDMSTVRKLNKTGL